MSVDQTQEIPVVRPPAAPPASAAPAATSGSRAIQITIDAAFLRGLLAPLLIIALLVWPLLGPPYYLVSTGVLACIYLIIASSLVLLTGLIGQISLCQATLVGVGAFVTTLATHNLGLHFPWTIVVGIGTGAVTAAVIGVVALRVRGLFFAVATLIFAYVADQYLFQQPWLVGSLSGTSIKPEVIGQPGTVGLVNLTNAHDFYYVALAGAAFAVYAVANLRDSRLGRAFAALRGSEIAAASLGVDVVRTKIVGFLAAGALAGFAGTLLVTTQQTINPAQFNFLQSLFFLSIAVVGGLRSLGGAASSSVLFAVLVGVVFFKFPAAANYLDLISAGLLIAVLLFFRGGLGALPGKLRAAWQSAHAGQVAHDTGGVPPSADAGTPDEAEPQPHDDFAEADGMHPELAAQLVAAPRWHGTAPHDPDGTGPAPVLSGEHVTVRFGGLTAVDDVSLHVNAGEIVGLIGPNGAGKTTFYNALLGLNNPTAGRVHIFGQDVSGWPVHRRAALGVGRTFQVLQLFPDLTVFDNLLVGTHLQDRTGLFGGVFATPAARRRETAARTRVTTALAAMGLTDVAERTVGDLPFGVLRLVEIARTLVTGAPLVFLDEATSGLDSTETERLILWLRELRGVGVSMLVIEHDVAMVTQLCDRIYVLDQGKLIASGTAEQIRKDPAVIASYLGQEAGAA